MENIVCKSCGGSVTRKGNYYICDFCRSKWIIDSGNDVHAVERANAWEALRNNDFEKSAELFENIIVKDASNHEAFWGRALALNGIVYVTDYNENKKVPTCNNITEESFLKNKDVQKAISLAPLDIKESYQKQAEQIEKIRIEWLNKASKEPAYDVFISFKDSDREHGIERTQDSIDVQDLYTALVAKGYNVFFSRVTLRDKVSEQYEPYIYNALKTAKVMIVFGEKAEYFNAVWVKNEWSRFKTRVEKGEKHKNSLITVYKGVNPYEIPVALTGGRQAIDYSIPSNYEVLMNHIKRVIDESEHAVHLDRIQIKGGQMAKKSSKIKTETLLTRELGKGAIAKTSISEKQTLDLAHSYLMGRQWEDANKLLDDLLFNNPNLADAIWYKLQAKFQVTSDAELFKKISSFVQEDYDTIARILNCAEKERATYILNSMYALCKNVSENTNLVILNTILPFNYDEREDKIAQAFVDSISSQRFTIFKLLLSTLDSKDVDTYIKYNLDFAKNARNVEAREACLNNIISVDEGNKEAQKMRLTLYLDRDDVKNAIKTLETILKYSSDHKKVVCDLLVQIKDALNSNEDCLVLREVIKYYPGELVEIKDLLRDVAFIMIRQGHFEHAKYLLSLILTIDENNPQIYWGLCLVKTKSRSDGEISKSNIPLKQVPEYTKYLTMVDEVRRQECFKIAKKQENAEASRKKAKKVGIFSGIAVAVVAIIVAVVMIFQNVIIPSNQYKDASALIANGQYEEARDIYENLGDYKNAAKHIAVLDNMEKIDDGEYQTAVKNILSLGVPVKVNYALDGGSFNTSLSRTVTVDEEERFTSLSSFIDFKQPAKTGYNFSEWEHVSYSYVADGDFTLSLKAKWTTFDYTITYNLDGGLAVNPEGYSIEDDTFNLINPTKKGYSFEGWTSEEISTPTKTVTIEKGSTGNREFTAHWSVNTYTISFDVNGGTLNPSPITTTFDSYYLLPVPEMEYYEFAGWYYNGSLYKNGLWLEDVDFTLTARWEPIAYNINYIMDGGLNSDNNPSHYTIESNPIVLADANRKGYNFLGWYRDNTFTKEILKIESNEPCNIDIYAKWEIITYSITYNNTFGLENKNQTTYTVEDEIELLDIISITNPFVSWHKNSFSGESIEKIAKGTAEDLILFADFEYEFNPIYNKADLKGMCKDNTIITDNICILMSDIDLGNDEWISLGKFTGFLEGNGFCISNFKITDMDIQSPTASGNYNLGLFSQIYGGVVNLSIKDFDININTEYGALYVGGLSGVFDGIAYNCNIEGNIQAETIGSLTAVVGGLFGKTIATDETFIANCTSKCIIQNADVAGGLIGESNNTKYLSCASFQNVTANKCAGGLIGNVLSKIAVDGCYSLSRVVSEGSAGGLIGFMDLALLKSEIINTYATGKISGKISGGLIGEIEESRNLTISDSYAIGEIEAYIAAGGLVGFLGNTRVLRCWASGDVTVNQTKFSSSTACYAGGLIARQDNLTIKTAGAYQSYADGNILVQSNQSYVAAGGLIGYGQAANCYSKGNIEVVCTAGYNDWDDRKAGGLIGYGHASNCYSVGTVSISGCQVLAGGLIGYLNGNLSNCFTVGDVFANGEEEATAGAVVAGMYSIGTSISKTFYSLEQSVEAKSANIEKINENGILKDSSDFSKSLFYKNIVMWDETIWNIKDGELPTLKWELNR